MIGPSFLGGNKVSTAMGLENIWVPDHTIYSKHLNLGEAPPNWCRRELAVWKYDISES